MSRRVGAELGIVSLLVVAVYVALYRVQRSLFDNGLTESEPGVFPRTRVDIESALGDLRIYLGLVGVLCVLYAWVLFRAHAWTARMAIATLIAVPVAIQIGLLFTRPTLSIDAYSYLAHGYLAVDPSRNPYQEEAAAVSSSPYGDDLQRLGWLPMHPQSPYGPVWTQIERLVVWLTGTDVETAQVLVKLPAFAASLGCAALIFALLNHLAPSLRWAGTAAWLWNPMNIIEFAGDGHIDALMIFFVLVAIYYAVRARTYLAGCALGLAALVKYLPVLFGPPLVVYLMRHSPAHSRVLLHSCAAVVTTLAVGALAFNGWWIGSATFDGVTKSGTPYASWSPSGLITTVVSTGVPEEAAPQATRYVLVALLLVVVLGVSARVRTTQQLLWGLAVIALAAFALLPGGWPWYAALPVAILLCVSSTSARIAVLVLTVTTRSIAAFGDLQLLGAVPLVDTADIDGFVGVSLPTLICLPLALIMWLKSSDERKEVSAAS
ncbi:MAG: glycosyltransferase 87 family protein [Microbacterium sp.]